MRLDKIKAKGTLKIYKNGQLVSELNNLIVTVGLNVLANRLAGSAKNPVSHMAIGTGLTAPNLADTSLETQKGARMAATSVVVTGAAVTITAVFPGTSYAGVITEAGLFNALSLGEMISRVSVAPAQTIGTSDVLTVKWTITFSN